MASAGYLTLGQVAKPHGLQGEVLVALFADAWTPFEGLARCWVSGQDGAFRPLEVEGSRSHGAGVILKLAGVETPEAAAALVGSELAIPRAEAPAPAPGTYYHYDLLGLRVVSGERMLGTVREILCTSAHDLYVVDGPSGEWILPAARAYIRCIDLAAGRIELDPAADVPGLMGGPPAGGEIR
jgi:16S rRNA processing protein RimM